MDTEDVALQRFEAAKKGGAKWVVGTKEGQPGLSEIDKKGNWVGTEIDYIKIILDEMGLKEGQYRFKAVPSDKRENALADGGAKRDGVDIFIGTYSISESREKGSKKKPPVIFAGPYLGTPQKLLMQKASATKVLIKGHHRSVRSYTDLPTLPPSKGDKDDTRARLCVIKGSTGSKYAHEMADKGEGPPREKITEKDDYQSCANELTDLQDALLSDATILRGIDERDNENGDKYVIAEREVGGLEEYGIGLNKNSRSLKGRVCDAMEKTSKKREAIYKKFEKDRVDFNIKMKKCT
ncbi:transporter substrate-binding domain-containing protein [Streptomyces sp. NPDC059814]|uniref:transporter substrate-binding domain-containing protein n=1 Tax=Streptomyces sp. NPDC059814 TaxID=3346959 RepID=UPI0036532B7A